MKENEENYNGDLTENIIQNNSQNIQSSINENQSKIDNKIEPNRRKSIRKNPNEIFSEFYISSIIPHSSTANQILEKKDYKYNEDYF